MSVRSAFCKIAAVTVFAILVSARAGMAQEGIVLTGVGAINRSMGGASTAAPIDASGAIYWNPASISGLPRNEMEFGLELLAPQTTLHSTVPANALGLGIPPATLSGFNEGDNGVYPLPSFGLVYRPEESPWTFGLGVFEVGGFAVNYPASPVNPILQPPPLQGLGVGPLFAELQVFQVVPTVAYQLSDRLSIGVAPTLTLAHLIVDPNFLAPADRVDGTPFVTFPRSAHSPIRAGGGVQAGVYYTLPDGWQLGASIKSPQWMEKFFFNSLNAQGQPLRVPFALDYPMIASAGVAYAGFPRWLLATDFHWVDYANTDGFRESGFAPNGSVQGTGFKSIFGLTAGAQYQLTESLSLRVGYSYNQSPIPRSLGPASPVATIDAAAPTILEHAIYCGASWRVSDALILSAAYAHGFENSFTGVFRGPTIIVPGSSTSSDASADAFILGVTVQFGPCRQ
jgi:long-chain fatty acid transport protein